MNRRLVYLDVLRAVAILLVIGRHQPPAPVTAWGHALFNLWHRCGWVGVDLFFCLSGFLIGGLLFDEYSRKQKIDLKRFYIRRGFKIWPSYLLFVTVAIAARAVLLRASKGTAMRASLVACWPNLLHVQNYFGTPWAHTWSLAVEEHFYLVMPLLLLLMTRRHRFEPFRRLPLIMLIVAGICLGLRLLTAGHGSFDFYRNVFPTHLRIDSLLAGVFLGYAVYFRRDQVLRLRRWRWPLLALGCACFTPTLLWDLETTPFIYTWGFSLLILGSLCITAWSWYESTSGKSAPRAMRGLAAIGAYSYSIYLWHNPFALRIATGVAGHLCRPESPLAQIVITACFVTFSVLLGMALYTAVEWPALAARDRMFPSNAVRVAAATLEPSIAPPPGGA